MRLGLLLIRPLQHTCDSANGHCGEDDRYRHNDGELNHGETVGFKSHTAIVSYFFGEKVLDESRAVSV